METTPKYSYIFDKDNKRFEICDIQPEDMEETTKLVTDIFQTRDPLSVHLQIPYEQYHFYIKLFLTRSMEDKLCLVCKDTETSKVVGTNVVIDQYRDIVDPVPYKTLLPKDCRILELETLLGSFEAFKTMETPKPYERALQFFGAVDEKYAQYRLMDKLFECLRDEHPYGSKCLVFLCDSTNAVAQKSLLRKGFEVVNQIKLNDYKKEDGTNPFEGFEETVKKLNASAFENVYFMRWNRKVVESQKVL